MPEIPLRPAAPALPAASAAAAGPARVQQADFIVAVVNSEPITNSEVRSRLQRVLRQMAQQGNARPQADALAKEVLERLIIDKTQLQLARESGVRADSYAVEAAVQTVARQNQVTLEGLKERLKADNIAYSQFESDLRDELLISRLRQREVEPRVKVSDQEIDQFLSEQNAAASSASALNLAQVLVAVPENATAEQLAALQLRAQQVADRARSGTPFAELAAASSDPSAAATGGEIGLRPLDRLPPLFVEATQKLAVGGIAGPLRSGAGFHVLKVIEKKPAGGVDASVTQSRARHILLPLTPQQNEAAAVQRLISYKRRIEAGQADFAALAREHSSDGSARDGGDLGWAAPGMFVPEFEQALNALAPGQVSDPVVSRFGVHLIQLTERREAKLSSREQREAARAALREKKFEEAYLQWAQEVRGRAYVEYRDSPS
jgi:peptidyl-prolyl cis-trans isomerase SurA